MPNAQECDQPEPPKHNGRKRMHSDTHSTYPGRIDAHHHLWRYTAEEFDWLVNSLSTLRRNYLVEDLLQTLPSARVDGTIVVQARQKVEETQWLLHLAQNTPAILGVVGWLPIRSPGFDELLERFAQDCNLKGLRHVVQAEPEGFLDDPAFDTGITKLKRLGITYDLLIFERQLSETIRFVDRHPSQFFVLDHIAKPRIAANQMEPWSIHIRQLARRQNVACKVSGMVTEADPQHWKQVQLKPYFETVLDAFGPNRLMIGTDWPVLTASCSYANWWRIVEEWTAALSSAEKAQILGGTAAAVYKLAMPGRQPISSALQGGHA